MKKILFLLFVYINACYALDSSLSENDTVIFEKAKANFDEKSYEKSYKLFKELFLRNLEHSDINYFLAKSAIEVKEYGTASAAFERILIKEPNNNLVKFEQAKLLYINGNEKDSEKSLKTLLKEEKLKEELEKSIKEYIDFINKNKKLVDVLLTGMVGVNFNSNATNSPNDKYILPNFSYLGEQGDEVESDINFFHLYNLDISKKFLDNENAMFKNNFTYFNKIYKDEKDENFEYLSYKPSFLLSDKSNIYSLGASFERLKPKTNDGDEYHNSYGISSFIYNKDYMLSASAKRYFYDEASKEDKNYSRYQGRIQFHDIYGFKFSSMFTKDIKFKSIRTDIDKFHIDSILSYNYEINDSFSVEPSFRYKMSNYKDESIAFGSKRKDRLKEYRLNFKNVFNDDFFMTFYLSYLDNHSNHDEYKSDNTSVGIFFVKKFDLF